LSGNGATNKGARSDDAKIAVEKLDLRFAHIVGPPFHPVHGEDSWASLFYAMAARIMELQDGPFWEDCAQFPVQSLGDGFPFSVESG
jgi:hypothetical protein